MKPTSKLFFKQHALPLLLLSAAALIIWFGGPWLSFGGYRPLQLMGQRAYVILILLMGWILKIMFFDTPAKMAQPAPQTETPEALKKLQILQGRFEGALQFLKKTMINKHNSQISLDDLPWYFLIGPTGAGKTTLLANANINYLLAKQFKSENINALPSSETCDWWATRDIVLIDVPGNYIATKQKTNTTQKTYRASLQNILWQNLLNLTWRYRKHQTLGGIVIALHLPELMKKTNGADPQQWLQDLKQRISELRQKFGADLPFYIIITKCDLLPGFQEFFSDSSSEELMQAWGVTLPDLKGQEKLIDMLAHRFNALIKRLNKQLIWRLHQERNSQARTYIKDFPLQLERLKDILLQVIKSSLPPELNLQGVYLTCALQEATRTPSSHAALTGTTSSSHAALQLVTEPRPARTYFVKQLLLQGLQQAARPISTASSWHRRTVYGLCLLSVLTVVFFLGKDFQQGVAAAYSIQQDLAQYQLSMQKENSQKDMLLKALPLLNELQHAATQPAYQLSHLANLLTFYSQKSKKTAQSVYQNALQTIVLPQLKNTFETFLRTPQDKNPEQLYTVLRAYLMLSDPTHLDVDFLVHTLNPLVANLQPQQMDNLNNHIALTFKDHWQPLSLNRDLIAQTRKTLTSLTSLELCRVILHTLNTNNMNNAIRLGTNGDEPSVFISKAITNQIPNMFTATFFDSIMTQEIPQAAAEALQGNWVLGTVSPSPANTMPLDTLTDQARTQYVSNYIDLWESLLANIQLAAPKNLTEIDTMILGMTSDHSPLLELLQTIRENTAFNPIISNSPKLQALNTLLGNSHDSQNTLYKIFTGLRQLHLYLEPIISTQDTAKAILHAAAWRAQNAASAEDPITIVRQTAAQSCEPLKSWLTNLANQSWNFILQDAVRVVNDTWLTDIMPQYNAQIANRYPFNQDAPQEIALTNFSQFMGAKGTLALFYQTYLKPFVNESGEVWQWRSVDNQKMPFSDEALQQFQQAAKLQRAFFPHDDNTVFVEFTLKPISLDDSLKSFSMNINGQSISYQSETERTPAIITWPGKAFAPSLSMHLLEKNSQPINTFLKGDWAWFRLVTDATESVNNRKEVALNLKVKGHTAKYLLLTEGHMNPFLPLNLERFRLPPQLNG